MTDLIVPRRFCGPPSSGNGGWTAGALAALVEAPQEAPGDGAPPTVEVSLRRPPPLDVPMAVTHDGGTAVASVDGSPVASARLVEASTLPVEPVDAATARAARSAYPGLRSHPFPTCFACGTGRAEGDGLRIFPGPVEPADDGSVRVAATWTPDAGVAGDVADATGDPDHPRTATLPVTWAAIDCVGGWAGDLEERLMVLGRMTARVDALPVVGDEHVVVGRRLGTQGRRTSTAATLYDPDGRVVAYAEHVWIAVYPKDFA